MEKTRLYEVAASIRMNAWHIENTNEKYTLPLVTCDDSEMAQQISADPREYIAPLQQQMPVFSFPDSCSAADIAKELIRHNAEHAAGSPGLIVIAGVGIFAYAASKRVCDEIIAAVRNATTLTETSDVSRPEGRFKKRIALITGSAQGFGKGIAEHMVAQGAHVVIADLQDTAGRQLCDDLNSEAGEHATVATYVDVTDAGSVEAAIVHCVREFGGLDICISNAGVLKAGALHELSEKNFDLVTDVNYKAFFLCTRAALEIMRMQHTFNASYYMDIIQINSKSGLAGSNKNFAYAGSKFGGIGLVQSFAKELVEYNIKVNAICPGNYYEGPLWSDPQTGLFKQYLEAGKVPGARTIEDVKDHYMNQVPFKRGCSPRDVTRALVYCFEQEYETGQAMPVTGGQIMLK